MRRRALLVTAVAAALLGAGVTALAAGKHPAPCRHPVDVVPETAVLPPDAPLVDGKLACISCHVTPTGGPIRWPATGGIAGSPAGHDDVCFRCHKPAAYERFYPHEADPGDPVGSRLCLQCHAERPEPGTPGVKLRAGVRAICRGCHRPVPHVGAAEHIGTLAPDMDARRRAAEAAAGVILPLDVDGRMGCGTCHNPHDPAAVPPTSPAGKRAPAQDPLIEPSLYASVVAAGLPPRAAALGALDRIRLRNRTGSRLRLPVSTGELCLACHDVFGPPPDRGTPPASWPTGDRGTPPASRPTGDEGTRP